MKTIQRAGLGMLIALAISLSATVASAVEYDDIIGLAKQGVSDRTIVELIVKDGRAFEMNDAETQALVDAGVSQVVIDAMLDPAAGRTWLDGKASPQYDEDGIPSGGGGYSTSLDEAYSNGYSDGQNTSLVFSFGYYYGPLSRYYYCDPFYYSFWSAGYGCGYWPSYYASYYRPYYSYYCGYPYNYYNYNSYYCGTYYDPGYYAACGYNVAPGYGRTVWDNGPRWRDGGLPPEGGKTTFDGRTDGVRSRLLAGQFVDAGRNNGRPAAPPVVQPAVDTRTATREGGSGSRSGSGDLVGQRPSTRGGTTPGAVTEPGARTNRGSSSGRGDLVAGTRTGGGNGRIYRVADPGASPTQETRTTRGRTTEPVKRGGYAGISDHLRSTVPGASERGNFTRGSRTVRVDPERGVLRSFGGGYREGRRGEASRRVESGGEAPRVYRSQTSRGSESRGYERSAPQAQQSAPQARSGGGGAPAHGGGGGSASAHGGGGGGAPSHGGGGGGGGMRANGGGGGGGRGR